MRFVKYSHSCVRIETGDAVLVIDPGAFSEASALDGVDAVLLTHEHFDHLDIDKLTDALARRPEVRIFTHADVVGKLGDLSSVTTTVASGERFTAAGLPVRAFGGLHAEIHPDIPRVTNLGFLVADALYHPGDSFDLPGEVTGVDTVFVPVSGPWLKLSESVDFVRAIRPRRAVALHDCLLSDAGFLVTDANMSKLSGCEYTRLATGAGLAVSAVD
ncbi:MBL fold metallo-hydrolase [Luedemannella helvata]|uniref:MBL fold metallo-hydrolase n=1 Tax=Luedemannella helvata TaxID=349315 RepID=A0ABN2JPU4_9ACTN